MLDLSSLIQVICHQPIGKSLATILTTPIALLSAASFEVGQAAPIPPITIAQTTAGVCPAQLPAALNRIATRSSVQWSVLVQSQGAAGNRTNLYNRNAAALLAPASNNKLLTTAAALTKLGPQYRLRTVVTGSGNGANLNTLRIIGQGDPSLTTIQLNNLVQQLSRKGIRQVTQLIGDDTYFRGAAINPNWQADDTLAGYGAPVNSLMLNQNSIGLTLFPQRVGQPLRIQWDDPTDASDWRINNRTTTVSASQGEYVDAYRTGNAWVVTVEGQLRAGSASELVAASIPNPGNYLIQKFRSALAKANIQVNQATVVKSSSAPPGETELAAIESPPLSQLLQETNRESNNTYAEALLKTVGRIQSPINQDATAAGVAAIKAVLTPLGVNPNRYNMVDGSGLAARNRASAEAFVQTLQAMAQSPYATVFQASLPVAGVSGTLKNRFRNTPVQGRLQAKTGTIGGVVSLSGYLTPPNYSPVVLSIIGNYGNDSAANVRQDVDDMVLTIARLRACGT
ncbi:D-alanyl-D-alanine carboxypeptidase/D-alanyl-D-alanine endopeptidase [Pantanalinema sp. GBBB05]|uniref:D-alanyl-D-alanine carboxypeptidase/D-alanyl-D-alanine endopeptidase n=1 Tax=Pantanalinema sp. GBBB05 TaxID=2604139 RepID=UPI001E0F748E|nr:D-alanyl-D-alanine carboxypeptidase/D-alanyl-D-alanine-endopeptidase [Pantanalinema sp. GBBB05]